MRLLDIWSRFKIWLLGRPAALPPPSAARADAEPQTQGVPIADPSAEINYQAVLLEQLEQMMPMATRASDALTLKLLHERVATGELELPRMPSLAAQLLALDLDGPEDSHHIAELLKHDRDVTARVMEAANNAGFRAQPARTLEHAIVRLGLASVQQIAAGAAAHAVIFRIPGYEHEADKLRTDALIAAQACQALARAHRQAPGEAFLSALFHDVGKVIILRTLSQVRARTKGGRASTLLMRRLNRQLHVPLGAVFAQARGLPRSVEEAICFHHEPIDGLSGLVWAVQALQADPEHPEHEWEELAPERAAVEAVLREQQSSAA